MESHKAVTTEYDMCSPIDVYDHHQVGDYTETRTVAPRYFGKIFNDFREAFSHVCAGGSSEREKIFFEVYVTPTPDVELPEDQKMALLDYLKDEANFDFHLTNDNDIRVNASRRTVEILCDYLCKMAHLPRTSLLRDNDDKKLLFFTGAFGEGKTFFVNYLLTTCQHIFERSNVITVKIDLGKAQTRDGSIENQLCLKTLKILKTKYFRSQDSYPRARLQYNDLEEYLGDTNWSEQASYILGELKKPDHDISLQGQSLCDACEAVVHFVSFCKRRDKPLYKFLFIIDGLDNFNRDFESGKYFDEKIAEVESYIIQKQDKEHCYLLVTRNESYLEILSRSDRGTNDVLERIKNLKLFPVNYTHVIQSKMTVFQRFIKSSHRANNSDNESLMRTYMSDNTTVFSQFLFDYVEGVLGDIISPNGICDFFNNNMRDIVNFYFVVARSILFHVPMITLSSMNPDDVKSEDAKLRALLDPEREIIRRDFISKYHYLLLQGIMTNEHFFALSRYYISFDEIKDIYDLRHHPKGEGRSLLPNLLQGSMVYVRKHIGNEVVPHLIKVRILQLSGFLEASGHHITFEKISDMLCNGFEYMPDNVLLYCNMLYAEQCLRRDRGINGTSTSAYNRNGGSIYKRTERGRAALTKLLYKYEYVANAVDEMYMDTKYINDNYNPWRSVSFVNYKLVSAREGGGAPSEEFYSVVASRIYGLVMAIQYIIKCEERQKELFLQNRGTTIFSWDPNAHCDDLEIGLKRKDTCSPIIKKHIASFPPYEQLTKYIDTHLQEYV